MKKNGKIVLTIAAVVLLGLSVLSFMNSRNVLDEATIRQMDPGLVRVVELVPIIENEEYVAFYESTEGIGVAHFERMPILNKWMASERIVTKFERGISQNYSTFKVGGNQADFTMVYGEFAPVEDYNLPIRLRNLAEQYDEEPLYVESANKDIIWYQILTRPSSNPEDYQVYNGITGTVIAQ